MNSRDRLMRRIGDINNFDLPRPVVTLEEFFEDNSDYGSIGYNLPDTYSPPEFYAFFRKLREHPSIADVLIEVKDLEDEDGWPSTDTVWFVTMLTEAELARHFEERVRPDEWISYPPDRPMEPIPCPAGYRVIGAWYD